MKTRAVLFIALFGGWATPAVSQSTERLYQEACDGGDMVACNVFGLMHETGIGVSQDLARALNLFQRACEGGEPVGCTNVGLMYETGVGVDQDIALAEGFYHVACESGEPLGCRRAETIGLPGVLRPLERFSKSGRVGDADTGEPLGQAVIELPGAGMQEVSDASGRFAFTGLPPGRYALRAERVGYEVSEGVLQVPGNPDFLVLLSQTAVGDPDEPGRVVGRVTESGNRPLSDVEVRVEGQSRAETLSNTQGRFTLRDVEPGLVEVRFIRLGYAPRTAKAIVQPGRTVEIATTMVTRPIELEPIQVSVRSSFLEDNGFFERAEGGWGTQLTSDEIDRIDAARLSEVLRSRVPGVAIQYGAYGPPSTVEDPTAGPGTPTMARAVSRRSLTGAGGTGARCILSLYVDGRLETIEPDLDYFVPQELEAIEVYTGIDAPIQYRTNACGVILLWTRRGA